MYIKNAPVVYKKGEETIKVHYTAHARDLESTGWELVKAESKPVVKIEASVEVNGEAVPAETDLNGLTKQELVAMAEANNIELAPYATKAKIIEALNGNG